MSAGSGMTHHKVYGFPVELIKTPKYHREYYKRIPAIIILSEDIDIVENHMKAESDNNALAEGGTYPQMAQYQQGNHNFIRMKKNKKPAIYTAVTIGEKFR